MTVIDSSLFQSTKSLQFVPLSLTSSKNLPAQFENSDLTDAYVTFLDVLDIGAKTTVVSNLVLNILVSSMLNYLWGTVHVMQIIAHFPLINVVMPANC